MAIRSAPLALALYLAPLTTVIGGTTKGINDHIVGMQQQLADMTTAFQVLLTGNNYVSLVDFGATAADADHSAAWQAAQIWCVANKKSLVVPFATKISTKQVWRPVGGNYNSSFSFNVLCLGAITWTGGSGTPDACKVVFDVAGWRGSTASNVSTVTPEGVNNVLTWDLDTLAGANWTAAGAPRTENNISTTGTITFSFCNVSLQTGVNNKGWRLGHLSQAGADLSNIKWIDCYIYGNGKFAQDGSTPTAAQAIEGQYGIQIEGPNCLTNSATNCTFAYLRAGITTKPGSKDSTSAYAPSVLTGNGDFTVWGGVFSHNYLDVYYNNEQPFRFEGTRHEDGRMILYMPDADDSPTIMFRGTKVDNYTGDTTSTNGENGSLIRIGRPCDLTLQGFRAPKPTANSTQLIILNNFSGRSRMGQFTVIGGGFPAGSTFYRIEGDSSSAPAFAVNVMNAMQVAVSNGRLVNTTCFPNRLTQ